MIRLIKEIFTDKDVLEIIGLLLCFLILGFYMYKSPRTVDEKQTKLINITFETKPIYTEGGEDDDPYIYFKAKGIDNKIHLTDCSLNSQIENTFLDFAVGDKVTLIVLKKNLYKKKVKFVSNAINVCGIKIGNKWILNLENYNECKQDSWKKVRFYGLLFGVLFLPFLIGRIKTIANKKYT